MSDSTQIPPGAPTPPDPTTGKPGLMGRLKSLFGRKDPAPAELKHASVKGESSFMRNFQSKGVGSGSATDEGPFTAEQVSVPGPEIKKDGEKNETPVSKTWKPAVAPSAAAPSSPPPTTAPAVPPPVPQAPPVPSRAAAPEAAKSAQVVPPPPPMVSGPKPESPSSPTVAVPPPPSKKVALPPEPPARPVPSLGAPVAKPGSPPAPPTPPPASVPAPVEPPKVEKAPPAPAVPASSPTAPVIDPPEAGRRPAAPTKSASAPAAKEISPAKAQAADSAVDSSEAKGAARRRPRVQMMPISPDNDRTNWRTPLAILGLLLLLAAAAVSIYYFTRETRLEVQVTAPDFQVQPKAYVVFNFAGKTSMLQRDFRTRQAPLLEQLALQEEQLTSARADLAGRQQRRKMLQTSQEQLQKEIPQLLERSQKELDWFWVQEGEALRKEYATFRDSLHQEIADRAKQLGLQYQRNAELDAIEVAANAFRLALYNAPAKVVVDEQRKWSEELLARWNDFEKKWNAKQLGLKDKAMAIKQAPGPKVAANEERINQLRLEIDAMDIELKALEDEVATYESRQKEAKQALEDTVAPFLRELLNVPGEFEKLAFDLPADGKLVVREIQERNDLPPGTYTLLIRGLRKEEEFWAVKDFTITAYAKNAVEVNSADFKPARGYLLGPGK